MQDCYLGFDTSCYTTSVAGFTAEGVLFDGRKVLQVERGERGLRQSEGLYQHIKQIPGLTEELFDTIQTQHIKAIGCSFSPTAEENSYMPVFLAGINTARCISAALQVPLFHLNHQAGHIRAALIGNDSLLQARHFYAFHLSGGTTDLLKVDRDPDGNIRAAKIGYADDLHIGQMVDRVGVALGCAFPAGPHLEKMAQKAQNRDLKIPSSVKGTVCSFSGPETGLQRVIGKYPNEEIAFGVYDVIARTIGKMLLNAFKEYGEQPVLLCGGVSSSLLFRSMLSQKIQNNIYWAQPKLSSDNAVGIAAIAYDKGVFAN